MGGYRRSNKTEIGKDRLSQPFMSKADRKSTEPPEAKRLTLLGHSAQEGSAQV